MNRLTIIGNCTRDPELRTTTTGKSVCTFNVAVNRRKRRDDQQQDVDFFRVSTWDALADNCAKYLKRGKKVAVIGSVSVHPFVNAKGEPAANMEVNAQEVEFCSEVSSEARAESKDEQTGMDVVNIADRDLPF